MLILVCIHIPPVKSPGQSPPNITIAGPALAGDAISGVATASRGRTRLARMPPLAADWLTEWRVSCVAKSNWLAVRRDYPRVSLLGLRLRLGFGIVLA